MKRKKNQDKFLKNTILWKTKFLCVAVMSKSYTIWDHFFSLLFPKDSKIKNEKNKLTLDFGKWGKKTFKRSEQMTKIRLKKNFAAVILYHFWAKMFQSETTSFQYFGLRKVGAKRPLNGVNKWEEKSLYKLFSTQRFYTILDNKISNLRPFISITFP